MPKIFSKINVNKTASPTIKIINQAVILAIVWLLLIIGFLLANYGNQPKLQRYQLEMASHTTGVEKLNLLKNHCGDKVSQTIYDYRNDPNFTIDKACTILTDSTQRQTLQQQSLAQLNNIQTQLKTAWQAQKRSQRQTDLVKNETGIQLGADKLTDRKSWLNLNDNGQLDSIHKLLAINTANFNENTKQNWAISLMAVADGNRGFVYSQLFASQPDIAKTLNQSARDIALIYEANRNQQKAEQADKLLPFFGSITHFGMMTQLFIWSWLAFLLLHLPTILQTSFDKNTLLSHPVSLIGWVMMVWGVVIAVVSHFVILSMQIGVIIACVGLFWLLLCLFSPIKKTLVKYTDNRELLASVWTYPLFVGFVTFGLLILFDLSTRSYLPLRYVFLNHFKDVFWCFVFISLSRPLALLSSFLLKKLIANNVLQVFWANDNFAKKLSYVWLAFLATVFLSLAIVMHNDPAKVSELAKMWLIVFLAVFLAINQRQLISQLFLKSKKMTVLLAFALLLPILALLIAGEKGTILVFLFSFTFLVGVALSNKIFQMGGRGAVIGVLSSTAILLMVMMLLVNLSGFDDRTAERVSSWINPFIATNDQMAILHWFRESVPMLGYGFGDIPWCGYQLTGCQGVPMQMQSDYTITSVMAVVGVFPAVAVMAVYFGWLAWIARQQMAFANEQMKSRLLSSGYFLLAWVILLWVVLTVFQALVTISGNLGMLPLTGVTLPFLSYGTSNLWFNTIMLSLALFQPKLMLDKGN